MSAPTIRTRLPAQVKKGEIIEIRAQIAHDMETGQRKDANGMALARRIIKKFVCTWNDEVVISADWNTAMSANPFVSFFAKADRSGPLKLSYYDENGEIYESVTEIAVQ